MFRLSASGICGVRDPSEQCLFIRLLTTQVATLNNKKATSVKPATFKNVKWPSATTVVISTVAALLCILMTSSMPHGPFCLFDLFRLNFCQTSLHERAPPKYTNTHVRPYLSYGFFVFYLKFEMERITMLLSSIADVSFWSALFVRRDPSAEFLPIEVRQAFEQLEPDCNGNSPQTIGRMRNKPVWIRRTRHSQLRRLLRGLWHDTVLFRARSPHSGSPWVSLLQPLPPWVVFFLFLIWYALIYSFLDSQPQRMFTSL